MADAVHEGAKAIEGVEVILKRAAEATLDDLLRGCNKISGTVTRSW